MVQKYRKDAGQILLRFEVQDGLIVLPKSTHKERIQGNIDIFDFEFTPDEMVAMRQLDTGKTSYDPETPGLEEKLKAVFVIKD